MTDLPHSLFEVHINSRAEVRGFTHWFLISESVELFVYEMSVRKINVRLKSVKVYDVIVSLVDVGKVLLYGWKWWKVQKERNFFIASCMFYIDSRQIRIDLNLIFMFIIRISYTNHSRLSLIRIKCVKPRTSARELCVLQKVNEANQSL